MRTGKARGRELSPLMPWIVFRNLNDEDLDALFAYLRALPKVKHLIDNIDKPTKCAICGGEHPLGQYNRPPELKLVSVPLAELKDTVGTYRFEDGFQVRIAIENGKLMREVRQRQGCELVTEDRRVYFCQGEIERDRVRPRRVRQGHGHAQQPGAGQEDSLRSHRVPRTVLLTERAKPHLPGQAVLEREQAVLRPGIVGKTTEQFRPRLSRG